MASPAANGEKPRTPARVRIRDASGRATSAGNLFPVLNRDCTRLDFKQLLRNEPSGTPGVLRRSCPTAATESSDPHSLLLVHPTQPSWRPHAAALRSAQG